MTRSMILVVALVGCRLAPKDTDPIGTEADSDTDADTDTDVDADTDADSDADVDADTDADSDADTDVDPNDQDGDGVTPADGDCDDLDPTVFPGAPERCDGVDNGCDGQPALADDDGDGDGVLDCASCEAAGLYASTLGLTGATLEAELHLATSTQSCIDYSAARIFMLNVLDPRPDGLLESVYTGQTVTPDGTTTPGNFNTEHTWPQSQGADTVPARCDLHHLYPTDEESNNRRGSYPFGEVTGTPTWSGGGSVLGTISGEDAFEPRDVHKGNVARSMLYFSLRYGYDLPAVPWDYHGMLVAWSAADPPDEVEVERTFGIQAEQGAVNPLVVCPWLVDAL